MSSIHTRRRSAFTILEIILVVGTIFLIFLAVLPAFKKKGSEPRYQLRPAATPANTPRPVPKGLIPSLKSPRPTPEPAATPSVETAPPQ